MSCLLISVVWAGGCQQPSHVYKQHVGPAGVEYARINIETQDLQQGMERMFFQIQSRLGPVDSEVIIRDHLESIRRDLYHTGFSRIRNLYINGTYVDIDIYFCDDIAPARLTLDARFDGEYQPRLSQVNCYYRSF